MKRLALALLLVLPFFSFKAFAQYSGPGVETCLAYAQKDMQQYGSRPAKVAFDRDTNLDIEKYTRKVGSQFVSSILTGNGTIADDRGASVRMSFVCLLANDKKAVFFYWQPRPGGK